jgi:hypothetical protein
MTDLVARLRAEADEMRRRELLPADSMFGGLYAALVLFARRYDEAADVLEAAEARADRTQEWLERFQGEAAAAIIRAEKAEAEVAELRSVIASGTNPTIDSSVWTPDPATSDAIGPSRDITTTQNPDSADRMEGKS